MTSKKKGCLLILELFTPSVSISNFHLPFPLPNFLLFVSIFPFSHFFLASFFQVVSRNFPVRSLGGTLPPAPPTCYATGLRTWRGESSLSLTKMLINQSALSPSLCTCICFWAQGGTQLFFQVGVCGPDFQSVGLANWYFPLKRGACELKISKFRGLWAENFQIWGLVSWNLGKNWGCSL